MREQRLIDTTDRSNLLQHLKDMLRVNSCMYYAGRDLMIFTSHIEDKMFLSTSFLYVALPRILYPVDGLLQAQLEKVVK